MNPQTATVARWRTLGAGGGLTGLAGFARIWPTLRHDEMVRLRLKSPVQFAGPLARVKTETLGWRTPVLQKLIYVG